MHIRLVAAGHKMPAWVDLACADFLKRLPHELKLTQLLIPTLKRGKNAVIQRIVRDESRLLLAAVPANSQIVALDVRGKRVTTEKLSTILDNWMQQGQDIALIIGGPDGVSEELLQKAVLKISLSDLTFPHPLVRVIVVEQLYRAWSILNNHPYHRG
ncbi:MAG: 23S rRNA (pseudouridine(1915)-N(3))-methyltransferase RlmH [Gammaproteobacteria bacterium]|jgi:23S rRNA (pseudouridine1915-N3)-methyltransferase|nr:23S rRNA (pseudouridine(1915)-N(3))-methyltransferase RlmH [Gammaproteobacteria bacterium]